MKKRVVVTGIGAVTPYGSGCDLMWENLINGKSAIRKLTQIELDKQAVLIGGEVPEFDTEKIGNPKEIRRYSKQVLFALAAAKEAIDDSKLDLENENLHRIGVIVGSGAGGIDVTQEQHRAMIEKGYSKASPFTIPMMIANMPAGIIAIKHGLKGLNKCVTTACATGTHSIGDAFRAIQYGEADVIVTGGTEGSVCDIGISAFSCARTLSKRNDEPEKASRPYDKDRDGFVMSEGAGVLVLEELEHALNRNAKIYAEVIGYGQNCDAYDMVSPHPEGEQAVNVMKLAMEDAGVSKDEISYINAHGTSTHIGDIAESKAIEKVFGNKDENKNLLVSSTKSMMGHSLGATGAVEAIVAIKVLENEIVPPTINLDNQDEEVANLDYVPHTARKHSINKVMSNSFGFGGCNAVLVFSKYE